MKALNLTGKQFGRLIVTKRIENDRWGNSRWKCKCICGRIINARGQDLKAKHTQSCGCFQKEIATKQVIKNHKSGKNAPNYKHGHCLNQSTTTYNSWAALIQRCTNKNSSMYKYYGGRGIKVCKRWLNSFENFYKDMKDKPNKNYHIHRIDNNKNYSKSNCKWKLASDHLHEHKGCI